LPDRSTSVSDVHHQLLRRERRLRDPECRRPEDHAGSEKEAEEFVGEYKIAYGQGWRVWFADGRFCVQGLAVPNIAPSLIAGFGFGVQ